VAAALAQFHAYTFFTRPRAEDVLGEDYDAAGRPDREKLASLQLPPDGDYFLCGPNPFMTNMTAALKSLGLPDSAIHQEAFGSDAGAVGEKNQPHPPAKDPNADPAIPAPVITFAKTGISFNWQPRFSSLLEEAEACNAPVSWSCRVGVCHRCETTLFSGDVDYTSPPLDPPAGGNILICCSVPRMDCQLDI
jgi:ferredoxin-NADP reductase